MPYTPFIHPDSGTIAWRYFPEVPYPAPVFEEPVPLDPLNPAFVFSDGLTIPEVDALYSQLWPESYWREFLVGHGLTEEQLDKLLESRIPRSPTTESSAL